MRTIDVDVDDCHNLEAFGELSVTAYNEPTSHISTDSHLSSRRVYADKANLSDASSAHERNQRDSKALPQNLKILMRTSQ